MDSIIIKDEEEKMREAFEREYSTRYLKREPGGDYYNSLVQQDWKAWKAAWRACHASMQPELDALRKDAARWKEHISRISEAQKDRDWQMMGMYAREASSELDAARKEGE